MLGSKMLKFTGLLLLAGFFQVKNVMAKPDSPVQMMGLGTIFSFTFSGTIQVISVIVAIIGLYLTHQRNKIMAESNKLARSKEDAKAADNEAGQSSRQQDEDDT